MSDVSKTELWSWANKLSNSGKMPTLRDAARRFGCSMDTIEHVIELEPMPHESPFELGLIVALGGMQGGGELDRPDWIVEAY